MEKRKKKIIMVDDVNFHLVNTKNKLKNHYEIFTALSSEILFDILENIIPDLILLDINMPEINGFEILKKLKADPQYSGIPVIFFTSNKSKENITKGMALGAVDFMTGQQFRQVCQFFNIICFTAGIGENNPIVRGEVCEYLGFLGIGIDKEANKIRGEDVIISTPDSKVTVMSVPTDEELMIARDTRAIVDKL